MCMSESWLFTHLFNAQTAGLCLGRHAPAEPVTLLRPREAEKWGNGNLNSGFPVGLVFQLWCEMEPG